MPEAEKSASIQLRFWSLLITVTHAVTHMEMLNVLFNGASPK